MKRVLALLLAMLVLSAGSMTVFAEETTADAESAGAETLFQTGETVEETSLDETADTELFSETEAGAEITAEEPFVQEPVFAEEAVTLPLPEDAADITEDDSLQLFEASAPQTDAAINNAAVPSAKTKTQNRAKTKKSTALFDSAAAPSVKNIPSGIKISWKKAKQAEKYRVYRRKSGTKTWTKLKDLTKLTYMDTTVKTGKTYEYLILPFRIVSGKKTFAPYTKQSAAKQTYLAMPKLATVKIKSNGLNVSWSKVTGAKRYRVYRRLSGEKQWTSLGETKKSTYLDRSAKKNQIYEYTVASVSKRFRSDFGSNVLAGIRLNTPKLTAVSSVEKGLQISWKAVENASGYRVYRLLSDGTLSYVGKTTKTALLDKNVEDSTTYCYTVRAYQQQNKTCFSFYDSKGVSGTYTDPVRAMASDRLQSCGGTLRKAFAWANQIPYIPTQDGTTTRDFAKYTFENHKGDCLGKAAAFCYMARELGYEAHLMFGWIPSGGGGRSDHGWVEIKYNGQWYVCDLTFHREGQRNGYMIRYGQHGTWRYSGYHQLP